MLIKIKFVFVLYMFLLIFTSGQTDEKNNRGKNGF